MKIISKRARRLATFLNKMREGTWQLRYKACQSRSKSDLRVQSVNRNLNLLMIRLTSHRAFASLASLAALALAPIAATAATAAAAATSWNGNYAYERTYRDASGANAGEIYNVTLGAGGKCRITMTGPKSHEDIICRVAKNDKVATLHFRRFADAKEAALNGARSYPKDQRLLSFEHRDTDKNPKTVHTVWHKLRTLDGKSLKGGVRFKRESK